MTNSIAHDEKLLINGHQSSSDTPKRSLAVFAQRQAASALFSRTQSQSIGSNDTLGSSWQLPSSTGGCSVGRRGGHACYSRHNSSALDGNDFYTPGSERGYEPFPTPGLSRKPYEKHEQRTLIARKLRDRTTHSDIVDFLRGGLVLDIYIRAQDRTAAVSFVEGQHAQDFMKYVKRNDIYIRGKRVSAGSISLE